MLDSAGSTLVEWGRQQQQHDLYDDGDNDLYDYDGDDDLCDDNGDDDDYQTYSRICLNNLVTNRQHNRNH